MKKLALLLLLPGIGFCDEFKLPDLNQGMYSYQDSNKIPDNSAAYIQNFYGDVQGLLLERNGYVKRDTTILGGTKPVYGLWDYTDSSGNNWIISYSSRTYYKNTIGGTPTAFGPTATVDQIPDCAKNLGKLMCVNGTDLAWTFDGTSTASVAGAPLGTIIEPWRTRFVIANITGSKSTVRVSADGLETSWTLGGLATDPFSFQIGGANDGEYVRCLVGSYLDSMIIGRRNDLWALDGFDQSDYNVRNISYQVGCIEPRTPQEVDGELVFLSVRGLEAMNGRQIRQISDPIRNITDVIVRNTSNLRSNTQTTQADFAAGTILPAGKLSTNASPGSVSVATMAATSFIDTVSTDFAAGTIVSLDTTTNSGSVSLVLSSESTRDKYYPSVSEQQDNTCITSGVGGWQAQSFTASTTYYVTSLTLRLMRQGSPGTHTVSIYSDNAGAPGTQLTSTSLLDSSVGTSTQDISVSISSQTLRKSTTYWVRIDAPSSCNNTPGSLARIIWFDDLPDGANPLVGIQKTSSGFTFNTSNLKFKSNGKNFTSTGSIVSRVFDVGFTTNTWVWNWGSLTSNKTIPTASTITYQTQTSTDGVSFDSLVPVADGFVTTSTVRRFIRYKASFSTTDISTGPMLNDLTLNYGPFTSTGGIYTSQLLSIGSLITSWGPLSISDVQSSGTIVHQFGSTNTASVSAITNWQTVTNGQIPTVSTNAYAAFRSSFVVTGGGANLLLSEFVTSWNEGGIIPSPVSFVYDRRYWISFTTTTTSSPVLDTTLIWQRNKSFVLFKGINAGSFAYWRDNLYFGNSNSTGYVYKFDTGTDDDGSNINSILVTKSYDLGQFFRDKDFSKAYLGYFGGANQSGSFSLSYDLNRYGTLYSLGSVDLSEEQGQGAAKFWFPLNQLVRGREIQYTLSKSGTGSRLKLYDLATKFDLKEEK